MRDYNMVFNHVLFVESSSFADDVSLSVVTSQLDLVVYSYLIRFIIVLKTI